MNRRWRNLLLTGGAALGAAATFNALTARKVRPLRNQIGGEDFEIDWRGHRIVGTSRGKGPPLLLVHGIYAGASDYEWRFVVDNLARTYRVVTVDLLGFGRSDRPDVRYSARVYTTLLSDVAAQVIGAPCGIVASSLSAAYAIVLGARDPERFPALVLVEPTGLARLHDAPGASGEFAKVAFDAPVVGAAIYNSLVSRPSLRYWLERVYANEEMVTELLIDHYFQAAHQPGARHAPSAFLAGQLNLDVRRALRRLGNPALLVWGDLAVETPVEDAEDFRAAKKDLELTIVEGTGMLPHDEAPEEFVPRVREFLTRVWPAAAPLASESVRR